MENLAEADTEKGYRKRAKDTYNKLEKEQLILNNLRQSLVTSTGVEHASLSIGLLGKNLDSSWWLFVLLGSLLEVTVGYLLVVGCNRETVFEARREVAPPQIKSQQGEKSPRPKTKLASKNINESTTYEQGEARRGEISPQLASPQIPKRRVKVRRDDGDKGRLNYENIAKKIIDQEWPPIKDKVKCLAKIGSKTVGEYFHQMVTEGIVCKEGGRYKVCEIT